MSNKFALYLDSVEWDNPDDVFNALEAKDYWTQLSPLDALMLLDANYAD